MLRDYDTELEVQRLERIRRRRREAQLARIGWPPPPSPGGSGAARLVRRLWLALRPPYRRLRRNSPAIALAGPLPLASADDAVAHHDYYPLMHGGEP